MCFVFLPFTLFLHLLKLEDFNCNRINLITIASFKLNCCLMASKGVLSSHAIPIIRSISLLFKSLYMFLFFIFTSFATINYSVPRIFPFLSVVEEIIAYGACFIIIAIFFIGSYFHQNLGFHQCGRKGIVL